MRDTVYLFRFLFPRKGAVSSGIQLSLLQQFKGFNEVTIPKYFKDASTPRSSRRHAPNLNNNEKSSNKKNTNDDYSNQNYDNYNNENIPN